MTHFPPLAVFALSAHITQLWLINDFFFSREVMFIKLHFCECNLLQRFAEIALKNTNSAF